MATTNDELEEIFCNTCRQKMNVEQYDGHFNLLEECRVINEAGHGQFERPGNLGVDNRLRLLSKKFAEEDEKEANEDEENEAGKGRKKEAVKYKKKEAGKENKKNKKNNNKGRPTRRRQS